MQTREKFFLTPVEMAKVLKATKTTRHPKRDYAMFLLTYRHGLRVSELISLHLRDVSFDDATLYVRRSKDGVSSQQPLYPEEVKALKAYLAVREADGTGRNPVLFLTERSAPYSRQGFHYLVKAVGTKAGFPELHPHMLRHSCGYALANKGCDTRLIQDYLGHRSIASTVRYTAVNPERYRELWR